jgi:uncharacterized membrane protein YccC
MLHGVLRMPPDLWRDDPIDVAQRHSRYVEASNRITEQESELERLRARVRGLETVLQEAGALFRHYETLHRAKGPGHEEKVQRNADIAARIEQRLGGAA